jgi:hypothetical protein
VDPSVETGEMSDSCAVCRREINLNEHSTTYSTAFLSKSLIIRSGKSISDTLCGWLLKTGQQHGRERRYWRPAADVGAAGEQPTKE